MILNLKRRVGLCLSVMLFITFFVTTALAQTPSRIDVEGRQSKITEVSKSLTAGEINAVQARNTLRQIRLEARTSGEALVIQKNDLTDQLENLGPGPETGETELKDVADRRGALKSDLTEVNALILQAKLNADDSTRLLDGLSKQQRTSFLSETFKSQKSAFYPTHWTSAAAPVSAILKTFPQHISQWRAGRIEAGLWGADKVRAVVRLVFLVLLLWPLRRWIINLFSKRLSAAETSKTNRYVALTLHIVVRVIPAAIGSLVIYQGLLTSGFITPAYAPSVKAFIYTILAALLADGLAVGIFHPARAQWRIIPLKDRSARGARRLSVMAILLVGLSLSVKRFLSVSPDFAGLSNVTLILTALGIAFLAYLAAARTHWDIIEDRVEELSEPSRRRWTSLRRFGMPLVIAILAALVLGYLNFAYFLSTRMVLLMGLIVCVWVIRRYLLLSMREFDKKVLSQNLTGKSTSREAMLFWAGLGLDSVILMALIPALLLICGTDVYSVRTGMVDAFTGITIGNFTISIADILVAIITFFVILFVTRFLQRVLDERLFEKSGANVGFRNSFKTLLGYVGLIIAVFAAIGVIGLDLSNLALIASALSVGIGFGLQSIVNNFVSGLILLFERPVKVGDWIVTSSGEGFVKHISVRSTEIETFDRASVIVPNSELISSSVTNWTHKNKMGRVAIPIGVAYHSDAKHVREILMELALENPKVLKSPEPFVYFKEFGGSSLDLELRVFIKNIADSAVVRNDLRFEILDVFRKENIEIPFPQHDVYLKK